MLKKQKTNSGAEGRSARPSGATQKSDEPMDARSHFVARPTQEVLGNQVRDSRGRSYYQLGASSYKLYLDRASELSELILDPLLPQKENIEVKHEGEGESGYWTPLNDNKRTPGTVLKSFTVNCWSRAQSKCTQEPYVRESWHNQMTDRKHIKQLSYCLNLVLRHY
jgi:hypothetical protein